MIGIWLFRLLVFRIFNKIYKTTPKIESKESSNHVEIQHVFFNVLIQIWKNLFQI